jgi:hypothetical protein
MTLSDIYTTLQSDSGPAKPDAADRIRQEAWQSPVAFTDFLHSVPLNETCALFEVYEVLLQDSQHFSGILMSELTRLLESAKADPHNASIYAQLNAFELVQDDGLRTSMAVVLAEALQTSEPQVRRLAADLAGACLFPGESALLSRLALAHDADWRVRLLAYSSLKDHLLALGPLRTPDLRLSVLDRVRSLLLSARVNDYAA